MNYVSLDDFVSHGAANIGPGPVGILLMEDLTETNSTIRHHQKLGFTNIIVLGPDSMEIAPELREQIHIVTYQLFNSGATENAINRMIEAFTERWIYYCYNGEYLFFPFCESRSIREVITFAAEERRDSILTYVIDLYAPDLDENPNGVSVENAHLDQSGYYSAARGDPKNNFYPKERQLDMFGGIRWRFEEHIPEERRRIDRIGIFKAKKGLVLLEGSVFNDEEYNTFACPWHNNLTAAICSFRTAKALRTNPGSAYEIDNFYWYNSRKFEWHSQQLMDLGLMEPGQWF